LAERRVGRGMRGAEGYEGFRKDEVELFLEEAKVVVWGSIHLEAKPVVDLPTALEV